MRRRARVVTWSSRVRVRVTVAATVVSLLGAALGATLFVRGLHRNLEQSLLDSARQQVDTATAQLEAGGSPGLTTATGKHDVVIQLVSPGGEVVTSDHPDVRRPITTRVGTTPEVRIPSLDNTWAVAAKRAADGRLVVVAVSEDQVSDATNTAIALLATGVPVGIVLLAVVVWLAIGRALRPIEVMRREAAVITSEHMHRRLAVPPGDDEIPRLAATLNQMLDGIDRSQQLQRQFVSDASHELRSPLATVRQMAEVARRHPDSTTVPALAEDVLAEETRMEQLVTALLTLARLDDQDGSRDRVVDLDDVVLVEVDRLRAAHPHLRFDRGRVSAGQVLGDPVLFHQVVANLLSNAVRHARTSVRVSLAEVDGAVALAVEDDGHGIPRADRGRVFERFARLDEARAREAGGAGLGLAIVRKVVELSHGTVSIDDSGLGGARFVVEVPAAATRRSDD
jgi:signal transduction histidine kinase